jgi:hypothetical protein
MSSFLRWCQALYQPHHPAFWLLIVLNASSSGLMWVAQRVALSTWGVVLVLLLALGNAWWSWRLVGQLQVRVSVTPPSTKPRH